MHPWSKVLKILGCRYRYATFGTTHIFYLLRFKIKYEKWLLFNQNSCFLCILFKMWFECNWSPYSRSKFFGKKSFKNFHQLSQRKNQEDFWNFRVIHAQCRFLMRRTHSTWLKFSKIVKRKLIFVSKGFPWFGDGGNLTLPFRHWPDSSRIDLKQCKTSHSNYLNNLNYSWGGHLWVVNPLIFIAIKILTYCFGH